MARPDPRKLKDEAQAAVARGKHRRALECYQALEDAEPKEGTWSHKSGELHRQLGELGPAVAALGRAADKYARVGFLVKAIAMCKLILRIDPTHAGAQVQIVSFNQERGIVIAPRTAEPSAATREASAALQRGAPIDRQALAGDVVADDGEIEIDVTADELSADERARIRGALGETPFLAALGAATMARLIDRVELVELAPGDVVFRQGEPGDAVYVIGQGEVEVFFVGADGAERPLGRLGDGGFFGEMALLSSAARTATVRASQPSQLLRFDRKLMGELIAAEPTVLGVLMNFLRHRLAHNILGQSALLGGFADADRRTLATRFRFRDLAPGEVLIEQGGRADGLYVVLGGWADVVRTEASGPRALATLGPGDVCGEMSLLSRQPAVATVRAQGRALALCLPAEVFRELIMTHPQVLEAAAQLADQRRGALGQADEHLELL